jgi:hypothetical protein
MEFRLTFFDCRVALEKLAAFGVETALSLDNKFSIEKSFQTIFCEIPYKIGFKA